MSSTPTASTTPVFYSADYVAAEDAFETLRKSGAIADSLGERPIEGLRLEVPALATRAQLQLAHTRNYIEDVHNEGPLSRTNLLPWSPQVPTSVRASTGGVLAAIDTVLDATPGARAGSLSSGLHHARAGKGAGFCTINGLAVGAIHARRRLEADRRVLILDTDAHCGGGTFSIIEAHPGVDQTDLSVDGYDSYHDAPGVQSLNAAAWSARGVKEPRGHHAALLQEGQADHYLDVLDAMLEARDPADYGLVLYNAGMDPFEDCGVGGLHGITFALLAERERRVFRWCRDHQIPVVFVMAGGYIGPDLDWELLVNLHRLTLEAAAS